VATWGTQDEEKQSKNKLEKVATWCTQDTGQTKQKQSRESGNIDVATFS
jgi:hypothetical protein